VPEPLSGVVPLGTGGFGGGGGAVGGLAPNSVVEVVALVLGGGSVVDGLGGLVVLNEPGPDVLTLGPCATSAHFVVGMMRAPLDSGSFS